MSLSNASMVTRAYLLNKLERRSQQRSRPDAGFVDSFNLKVPSFSIENSKTTGKLGVDELQLLDIPLDTKSRRLVHERECSVPSVNTEKKFILRKLSGNKGTEKAKANLINSNLACYFQYRQVSLCEALGKRDEYILSLRVKKRDLEPIVLSNVEVRQKLQEFYESKYRNRTRQNFNIIASEQLRSMKFKKKGSSITKHKKGKKIDNDEDSPAEEEEEEAARITDMATWKRRNGVGTHQKVFIIKGGYEYLRKGLLDRGWVENEDVWSPFFDLKWTTKIQDINFSHLSSDQIVNHFNFNEGLISKFGLSQSLRVFAIKDKIDVNKFFPRCYDLSSQNEFEDFVQNFKFSFAECILRKYLVDPQRYRGLELKVRIAMKVIERRLLSFKQKIDMIRSNTFFFINPLEWSILTETEEISESDKMELLKLETAGGPPLDRDSPTFQEDLYDTLSQSISTKLELINVHDPQSQLSDHHNVWIAKPNFLSRGRGIHCFNNLFDICNYCFGKDLRFVIQKYIEKPLLIEGRKSDIRQWVLVEGYNPPKIWVFDECYLRFCAQPYSLEDIYNRYVHLTNNSIQKHSSKFNQSSIPGNMWDQKQFSAHIGHNNWDSMQQKMIEIIILSIKSCEDTVAARKNSFELVGYDFMVDESYNPWLIEVNMSPAMDYSTKVTEVLVKRVLTDTVKVITDSRKNTDKGGFRCVYSGGKFETKYYQVVDKTQ